MPAIPLWLTAERRQRIGRCGGGRSAFALFVEGGVYNQPMPWRFSLDAYLPGRRRRPRTATCSSTARFTLTRPVFGSFSAGFGVWGGAQPGVYRLDAGPRVTMQVRDNIRVHLDWRQRLAGNAQPGSGPALTLGRGFLSRLRQLGRRDAFAASPRRAMDIYLPIAGQSVNALVMVVLGFLVGVLSGMFGVGGGFLTTPLLIFYGIPPTVAVASATTQITGASVSGVMVHMRRGGVDLKMGGVMIVGGLFGSIVGAALFRLLQSTGQIDVVIGFLYVLILGSIGALMLKDALVALGYVGTQSADEAAPPRHNRWVASLPLRWRFYSSGLYISPLAPLALGFVAGIADRVARHRRRLHPGAGDDLSARHAGAGRDRHQPGHDPVRQRRDDDGPCADHARGRHRARRRCCWSAA